MIDNTLLVILLTGLGLVILGLLAKWLYSKYKMSQTEINKSKDEAVEKMTENKSKKKDNKKNQEKTTDDENAIKEINLLVVFSHKSQAVSVQYNKQIDDEFKTLLRKNFIDPILREKIVDQNGQPQISTSEETFKFSYKDIPYVSHIIYQIGE